MFVVAKFKAPVPLGIIESASFEIVPRVAADPLPRFKVVFVMSFPVIVKSPARVTFPELSTVNFATPEVEAEMRGPVLSWFIVTADWPEEVARTASMSSISTDPAAEVILLFKVLF